MMIEMLKRLLLILLKRYNFHPLKLSILDATVIFFPYSDLVEGDTESVMFDVLKINTKRKDERRSGKENP